MLNEYFIFGSFFLVLFILVIIRNYSSKKLINFIWFCDLAPLLLAIGFFLRNDQFIKGVINVGLISQVISVFALFLAIFLNIDFVGFIDILNYSKFYQAVSFLIHLFSLILALFLTYSVEPTIISLVYSLGIIVVLVILTTFLTNPKDNINYAFNTDFIGFSIPYYKFLRFPLFFIFIILPTYIFQYLIYFLFH